MNQLAVVGNDAYSLSIRLSDLMASFVWDRARRKRLYASAPVVAVGLIGASMLLASAPAAHRPITKQPVALEHEEFTPPMVRLLADIEKATGQKSPPPTNQFSLATGPVATPFIFASAGSDRERAVTCLATAGWYEAGNDPAGQRAVMQVVLNRVRHPSFPKSVCGVVFQGAERRTGCQFSFTCDGSMTRRLPSADAWARARLLAQSALDGVVDADVRQATHFHADYVNPWWAAHLVPIAKVGAHIFYRWEGSRGALGPGNVATGQEAFPTFAKANNAFVSPAMPAVPQPAVEAASATLQQRKQAAPVSALAISATPPDPPAGAIQRHVMTIDAGGPNGRWALAAMERCGSEGPCRVVAYRQAGAETPADSKAADANGLPLFVFIRDASGMQVALWDCQRAARPRADQCLPSGKELAALLN